MSYFVETSCLQVWITVDLEDLETYQERSHFYYTLTGPIKDCRTAAIDLLAGWVRTTAKVKTTNAYAFMFYRSGDDWAESSHFGLAADRDEAIKRFHAECRKLTSEIKEKNDG